MVGTFRDRLATVSKQRFEEAIEDERNTLASGALTTYEQYRYHCGIIKGLQIALAAIDVVETELQQG